MTQFCTQCGEKIEDESIFCPYCGAKIKEERDENPNTDSKNIEKEEQKIPEEKPKGKNIGFGVIILMYLIATVGAVANLSLVGILSGGYYWLSKTKNQEGKKEKRYNSRSRKHGLAIVILSLISMFVVLLLRV